MILEISFTRAWIILTAIIHEILFMQIRGTEFRRHIFIFQGICNEVDA